MMRYATTLILLLAVTAPRPAHAERGPRLP